MKYSIVVPIFLPSSDIQILTDKNISLLQEFKPSDSELIFIEDVSSVYIDQCDIYIHNNIRTSPSFATQQGFNLANGEFIIFIGADVSVCKDFAKLMERCFMEKKDCGLASLGNNEHNDFIGDHIVKSLFFSICMIRKEDAVFDPYYKGTFSDTDMVFRLYTEGKYCYKNLNGYVYHKKHAVMKELGGNKVEYNKNRDYFMNKYDKYKNDDFFKELSFT